VIYPGAEWRLWSDPASIILLLNSRRELDLRYRRERQRRKHLERELIRINLREKP